MKLAIINMVCRNCVSALSALLQRLDIPYEDVSLGYARVVGDIDPDRLTALDSGLTELGLERIVDLASLLVEQVKHEIFDHINRELEKINLLL